MISDQYLEIPYFREESCLSSKIVVIAVRTGKCKRRRERPSVKYKQENENLQNISVCNCIEFFGILLPVIKIKANFLL